MEIDGSFDVTVELTGAGDVSLRLQRHDLQVVLDPAEATRICHDIWVSLGRHPAVDTSHAA